MALTALDSIRGIVFGLCLVFHIEQFLKPRQKTNSHRRMVNGLVKLERNLWISDKADQLDESFQSGDILCILN